MTGSWIWAGRHKNGPMPPGPRSIFMSVKVHSGVLDFAYKWP